MTLVLVLRFGALLMRCRQAVGWCDSSTLCHDLGNSRATRMAGRPLGTGGVRQCLGCQGTAQVVFCLWGSRCSVSGRGSPSLKCSA